MVEMNFSNESMWQKSDNFAALTMQTFQHEVKKSQIYSYLFIFAFFIRTSQILGAKMI